MGYWEVAGHYSAFSLGCFINAAADVAVRRRRTLESERQVQAEDTFVLLP